MYKILDISKYQPTVDYAKVAKAVDGVILRIGLTYWGRQNMGKDECFEKHYKGFKAVGLPVGVYYYSAADSVEMAKREAEYCLSLLKGKQFELPIYYDVENNERQGSLSKAQLTEIVDAFCSIVESKGYFVGYYSYTAWLLSKFDTAYLSKKYTLWKADYRTAYDKTIPCDMHQYTSGGTVDGINGRVDLNYCYRDFVSVIKGNGLNGFEQEIVETEDSLFETSRLLISAKGKQPMSKGDVKIFAEFCDFLALGCEVTNEGYIITDEADYDAYFDLLEKAEQIGNIEVKFYEADTEHPEQCAECDVLEARIKELERDLDAEVEFKRGLEEKLLARDKDVAEMSELYGNVCGELTAVNKMLAAERNINDLNSKEIAQLKDKLNSIKEIVGG